MGVHDPADRVVGGGQRPVVQRAFGVPGCETPGEQETVAIAQGHVQLLREPQDHLGARPGPTTSTRAQWLAAVRAALGPLAGMQVEVHRILADGDHVVVHSRRRLPGGGPEIVVVDIWRIDDGMIAEGWEIIEPVSRAAANLTWWDNA